MTKPVVPGVIPRAWLPSWLLLGLGLLLLGGFLLLTGEMIEAETAGIDAAALHLAQQWRASNPAVEAVMRDLSGLGSSIVLTIFTLATAGFLWVNGRVGRALIVAASMSTGVLALTALKVGIGRARPDPALAAIVQDGLSFPSGHSSMSAIFFLTLGALLSRGQPRRRVRVYVLGVALLCTGLIGFSRVALGVHWASDVVAGWAFGAGWAALWLYAASRWGHVA